MAGFAPVQEYVPQPAPVPDDVGMNSTLPLAFTAFLASGLLAQDPQSRSFAGDATVEATDLRIPVHTHAEDPSYGTWAAGGSYKACFDGGMTFYPELGPDYPHNQPLAWRTASVRVGDQELLTGGRAPAMSHSEFRVEYAHGAVTEAYDVRTEGLEQTFVFAQRPAANGDLCITGALRSVLLAPRTAPAVTDLVFSDENGMPILRYGRAVAIDVHGDSFPMTTSYLDGRITLRLAAADLARAQFPLVVDPLLAVSYTSQLGNAVALGDLDAKSYGSGSITATVCYTRHFSALDSDITVCTGTALLSSLVPRFSDLSSAASADHARSTYVAATNRWVVVYQNLIAATQVMQLRVAMFDAGTTSGSITTYAHLVASGTHEWRPEVGGVTGGASTKALVVYQQENGTTAFADTSTSKVMGAFVDTAGSNPVWNSPFSIYGSASEDAERPSVNRFAEGGSAFSWFVVCQTYNNTISGDDWDLSGRLVDNTGAVGGSWISSLGTIHKLGPIVDGRDGRFCVTYSTANTSIGKNQDVLGTSICDERIDIAHGAAGQSPSGDWPVRTLVTSQFRLLSPTSIAYNGSTRSHWQIGWRSNTTAPACYAALVGYHGAPLYAPDLVASTGSSVPGGAVVSYHDGYGTEAVIYMDRDSAGACQLLTRLWTKGQPASIPSTYGCGSGTMVWFGPGTRVADNQRIGSELTGVRTYGAPSGTLHMMVLGMASMSQPIVDPAVGVGCLLQVPVSGAGSLGILPIGIGADVSWNMPLPEFLPAMTLYFQDWMLTPSSSVFTNAGMLPVEITK
jgi:hypothetical protein